METAGPETVRAGDQRAVAAEAARDGDPGRAEQIKAPVRVGRVARPVPAGDAHPGQRPGVPVPQRHHLADRHAKRGRHGGRHGHRHRLARLRGRRPLAAGELRLRGDVRGGGGLGDRRAAARGGSARQAERVRPQRRGDAGVQRAEGAAQRLPDDVLVEAGLARAHRPADGERQVPVGGELAVGRARQGGRANAGQRGGERGDDGHGEQRAAEQQPGGDHPAQHEGDAPAVPHAQSSGERRSRRPAGQSPVGPPPAARGRADQG